ERVTIGLASIFMEASLCGSNHPCAILDGASAQQYMPMGLAGLAGKGCRNRQNFGTSQCLSAEKLREPQVVANGNAKLTEGKLGDGGLVAGRIGCRLTPTLAIVEIDIEHVDLVIGGDQAAIGAEEKAAIRHLA